MKKHANLSIFVPHAGCKHMCSFCDQRTISQTAKAPLSAEVTQLCDKYLPQNGEETQIAFFGGSFTAIEPALQEELLSAAYEFVKAGRAQGIRLSTRPDAIDEEVLARLHRYGVSAIELGAQSMNDDILRINLRGHTAQQVVNAAHQIKQSGFELGLQMMPGLYGASDYKKEAEQTLDSLLCLAPDTMRIYPAVVLQNTALAQFYKNGQYIPLTIQQAVKITAGLILKCEQEGVRVIRAGLAADAQLEKAVLSGPYHPAFRELCEGEIYYKIICDKILPLSKGNYEIQVRQGALSAAKGQKRLNEQRLKALGYTVKFNESPALHERQILLKSLSNSHL